MGWSLIREENATLTCFEWYDYNVMSSFLSELNNIFHRKGYKRFTFMSNLLTIGKIIWNMIWCTETCRRQGYRGHFEKCTFLIFFSYKYVSKIMRKKIIYSNYLCNIRGPRRKYSGNIHEKRLKKPNTKVKNCTWPRPC